MTDLQDLKSIKFEPNTTGKVVIGLSVAGGLYIAYRLLTQNRIVAEARKHLGQSEIPQNAGFVNQSFARLMQDIGTFIEGDEWCAAFARVVWLRGLSGIHKQLANDLLSKSTQLTFENFMNHIDSNGSPYFQYYFGHKQPEPKPGDLVIWRKTGTYKGHAGIFEEIKNGKYDVIEGNSDNKVQRVSYSKADFYNPTSTMFLRGLIRKV